MRNSKSFFVVSFLLGVATFGCKSAPPAAPPATLAAVAAPVVKVEPEFKLAPATAVGDALGMSLVVASPMKLVADLDSLSKDLQLPMALGQSLLPLLTSGAGPGGMNVNNEALERLDATRPLSVVWLARDAKQPVGWCAALAFKNEVFAKQSLQILGTVTEEMAGAKHIKTPKGEMVWAAATQRQLVLSDSLQNLLAGGAPAVATQTTPILGQMLFTINPAIMAKSTGQSLDALSATLLTKIMAELEQAQPNKTLTPASKKLTEGMLKAMLPAVSQIAAARLSLEFGGQHGLLLRAEMQPTKDSVLAEKLSHPSPFAFDPALPVSSDASMGMAWGDMKIWAAEWANVIQESSASGKAMAKEMLAVMESLDGGSCAVDLAGRDLAAMCSLSVRPGVQPAQVLDQYVSLLRSSNECEAELEARKPAPLKIKRAGKVVEIAKTIERKDPREQAIMKALFGGAVIRMALEVRNGRIVAAMGGKPRQVLKKYGKVGAGSEGAPIFKRALLDGAGADFMGFVDVMALFNRLVGSAQNVAGKKAGMMLAAVPGLTELRVPMVMSGSAGRIPVLELQLPFATLQNVARVVSGFMGQPEPSPAK